MPLGPWESRTLYIMKHKLKKLLLTLPIYAKAIFFVQSTRTQTFLENNLNPAMLVFIGELSGEYLCARVNQ